MSDADLKAIKNELNARIDGGEIHTSSWIPGAHRGGTVFYPIYSVACQSNEEAAAKCFGLILWEVMMERPEKWSFGHYQLNNLPIDDVGQLNRSFPKGPDENLLVQISGIIDQDVQMSAFLTDSLKEGTYLLIDG